MITLSTWMSASPALAGGDISKIARNQPMADSPCKVIRFQVQMSNQVEYVTGQIRNVSAAGSPVVAERLTIGESKELNLCAPGLHAYRFLIQGDGAVVFRAYDANSGKLLNSGGSARFDTTEVHGGHTFVFSF